MDIEEEILAFGETALWVECDLCGRAFAGPGLSKAIVAVGHVNICANCLLRTGSRYVTPCSVTNDSAIR
jgi:ribosome-binding protein aMBF1 (putative translation factor)